MGLEAYLARIEELETALHKIGYPPGDLVNELAALEFMIGTARNALLVDSNQQPYGVTQPQADVTSEAHTQSSEESAQDQLD